MNEEELLERQRQREIIDQIYANKPSLLNYGTRINAMGMMNDDVARILDFVKRLSRSTSHLQTDDL